MLGLTIIVVFSAIALLAPIPFDESQLDVTKATGEVYQPPSGQFWLGTDDAGRNVIAMVAWGARISLLVGLCATVLAMFIGTTVGIASGHYRGFVAGALNRITDWFLVSRSCRCHRACHRSPQEPGQIIIVIGVTSWPATARLIRAQTRPSRAGPIWNGPRHWRSDLHEMTRHVLPNVMPLVLANTTLAVSISILSETTLSFLGLGDPTAVSWGTILDDAFASGAISPVRGGIWRRRVSASCLWRSPSTSSGARSRTSSTRGEPTNDASRIRRRDITYQSGRVRFPLFAMCRCGGAR